MTIFVSKNYMHRSLYVHHSVFLLGGEILWFEKSQSAVRRCDKKNGSKFCKITYNWYIYSKTAGVFDKAEPFLDNWWQKENWSATGENMDAEHKYSVACPLENRILRDVFKSYIRRKIRPNWKGDIEIYRCRGIETDNGKNCLVEYILFICKSNIIQLIYSDEFHKRTKMLYNELK